MTIRERFEALASHEDSDGSLSVDRDDVLVLADALDAERATNPPWSQPCPHCLHACPVNPPAEVSPEEATRQWREWFAAVCPPEEQERILRERGEEPIK
jgi:hypothetical protein